MSEGFCFISARRENRNWRVFDFVPSVVMYVAVSGRESRFWMQDTWMESPGGPLVFFIKLNVLGASNVFVASENVPEHLL